jgi:hypothetical protein
MLWALGLKIFYIYMFNKPRIIGKHRKVIEGHLKGTQKLIFKVMKNIKKDIMGVKNVNFLVGENEISYF